MKRAMTRWHPRLDLDRLLDGLSEDILSATDDEVRQLHGKPIASTAHEVRLLIKAARADRDGMLCDALDEAGREPGAAKRPADMLRRPSHHLRH
jgi:hypothetical protein